METCKTCEYWSKTYTSFDPNHRSCLNYKLAECNDGLDELGYPYAEGGFITTGPDFGCIHHKEMICDE